VSNMLMIIPREVDFEILCLEVDKEIAIPRIIQGDVKEILIGEVSIDGSIGSIGRKSCNEFNEDVGFLSLGCSKFEVVLLKDENPSGKFSINLPMNEQVLHWVGIYYDLGSSKQNVMA
jgi:hypothetical protein